MIKEECSVTKAEPCDQGRASDKGRVTNYDEGIWLSGSKD